MIVLLIMGVFKNRKTNLALYVFFAKNSIMLVVVMANDLQKEELLAQGLRDDVQIQWPDKLMPVQGADCYIDLLFTPLAERAEELKKLQPATIIVNDVNTTLDKLPENFIRINGWPGFLKRSLVEAACNDAMTKSIAPTIFSCFNKTIEWMPDTAGFISARVLGMIINEAYFALGEGISSKEEIDTAMKLGTNYPYGPFEWGNKVGLKNVYDLLLVLAQTNPRYEPAALLKKEALL
jgi:3-hydroxybutyryl-CoA dehydrogenase